MIKTRTRSKEHFYPILRNMSKHNNNTSLIITGISSFLGIGFAWFGLRLIRNESRLLHRRFELEGALAAKTRKARRESLLRNYK